VAKGKPPPFVKKGKGGPPPKGKSFGKPNPFAAAKAPPFGKFGDGGKVK